MSRSSTHKQVPRLILGGVMVLCAGHAVASARLAADQADSPAATSDPRAESDGQQALLRELEQLREKVNAQERYIKSLERQLAEARLRQGPPASPRVPVPSVPSPEFPRRQSPIPNPLPRFNPLLPELEPGQPVPRDWQEREFNGIKYYLIPIKELKN